MEDIVTQIVAWLAGVNPLYAGIAMLVWLLFGDKIKALLSKITLPKVVPAPPDKPVAPSDPLEDHPLLDLLWKRLKKKFEEKPPEAEEEDLFVALSRAIKDSK